eukprot:g17729.t1
MVDGSGSRKNIAKTIAEAVETVPLQDAAVSQTPGSVRPISPVAWSGGKGFDSIEESLTDEGGSKSKEDDVCADGGRSLGAIFLGTDEQPALLNVLLVSIPLAFLARFLDWGHAWVFLSSLVALIPLAERISFVTEDVAKYTNQTLGGLLNATFGNITELVVCIFAIRAGLFRVVQLSMLGSVLSNLLLVLGSAFLVGGIRHKDSCGHCCLDRQEQYFNRSAAVTNTGLLIFAVLALSLPSILDETHSGAGGAWTPNDLGRTMSRLVVSLMWALRYTLAEESCDQAALLQRHEGRFYHEVTADVWNKSSWLPRASVLPTPKQVEHAMKIHQSVRDHAVKKDKSGTKETRLR